MTTRRTLPRHRLGRTGLEVSPIGFGGAVIGIENYLRSGDDDNGVSAARSRTALLAAVDAGITLFDTAPGYGSGRSEDIMGRVLEPFRDSLVFTTKVGVHDGDDPQSWTESLRASLDRLRTDRIDVLQLHGNTWSDEAAAWVLDAPTLWLEEMRGRGLVRAIGITAEAPSGGLESILRSSRYDVLQMAYSVIYQDACDYQREPFGVIPLAKSLGLGVTTMRTTTSGVFQRLLHSEFPELDSARLSRLAIKFVLSTPEVDSALIGMSDPREVEQNAALADDESDRLDLVRLHDFFGGWHDARLQPAGSEDVCIPHTKQ